MLPALRAVAAEQPRPRAERPANRDSALPGKQPSIRHHGANGSPRPLNGHSGEAASHVELVRAASSTACLQLWRSVVLQILADIDAGLRVLRGSAAPNAAVASTRRKTVREAHDAAMWLFGSQTHNERYWICSWIDVDPVRLQEAVRREHGRAVDVLLAQDVKAEADSPANDR